MVATPVNQYLKRIETWQAFLEILNLCATEFASEEPDEAYLNAGIEAIIKDVDEYQQEHGQSVNNVFRLTHRGLGKTVEIKLDVSVIPAEPDL